LLASHFGAGPSDHPIARSAHQDAGQAGCPRAITVMGVVINGVSGGQITIRRQKGRVRVVYAGPPDVQQGTCPRPAQCGVPGQRSGGSSGFIPRDKENPVKRGVIVSILCLGILLAVNEAPAWALNLFELEVYPYDTTGPGELEVETLNSYVVNGQTASEPGRVADQHLWRSSLEVNYGLTDHLEAAGYLDVARTGDGNFDYGGARFHSRYRFFEKDEVPVNLGVYVELEFPNRRFDADNFSTELLLILEKDLGPFTVQLNPIFEKSWSGESENVGTEFSYAAKVYYRWSSRLKPGIEFYGDIGPLDNPDPASQQKHYVIPVLDVILARQLKLNTGIGFGLTPGSNSCLIKFNLEYEFLF